MTWPNFSPTAARGQWNQLLVNHPLQKNLKLFIHLDSLWQVYAFHWGWPTFCAHFWYYALSNVKGYDECVDFVPKYILNPIFCLSCFPQSMELLSRVGEKRRIWTKCTRILYWGRILHKCLCTLTWQCMYHSDTHTSMPKHTEALLYS